MSQKIKIDGRGNLTLADGNILRFSPDFVEDHIGRKRCCFFCGDKPDTKEFNQEHVVPDWVISRYQLEKSVIVLPNGRAMKFTKTKIPSCVQCNDKLADAFEKPISEEIEFASLPRLIHSRYDIHRERLFCWMALLWSKYVLKSHQQFSNPNRSVGSGTIGAELEKTRAPLMLSFAQTFVNGGGISDDTQGSIFVFDVEVSDFPANSKFDICVLPVGSTIMLRFKSVVVIACLDDAGCAQRTLKRVLEHIVPKRKLTELQMYEILSRIALYADQFSRSIYVSWTTNEKKMISHGHYMGHDPTEFCGFGEDFDVMMCRFLGWKYAEFSRDNYTDDRVKTMRTGGYTYFERLGDLLAK